MKKILMLAVMLIGSISAFSQSYRGDMVMSNKVDTHDSISTFSLKKRFQTICFYRINVW
ncbi:MAG: hypothetical protein Q4B61_09085 [Bacteroidales bacterium]|nr:hypothetical protein [Bacteroidales bacterium]